MEPIGVLLLAFAGLLTVVTGVAAYPLYRLNKLEKESEERQAIESEDTKTKLNTLQDRVKVSEDQAARVPELERGLASERERLNTALGQIKDLSERLDKAEEALEAERNKTENLSQTIIEKDRRINELETENTALKSQNTTYREVFTYIGTLREKEALTADNSSAASTAQQAEGAPSAGEETESKKNSEESKS